MTMIQIFVLGNTRPNKQTTVFNSTNTYDATHDAEMAIDESLVAILHLIRH